MPTSSISKSRFQKIAAFARLVRPSEISFQPFSCPICDGRWLVRLQKHERGVRCLNCRSGVVQMSLGSVLRRRVNNLSSLHAYELSSRGPIYTFLKNNTRSLTCSEYFDDVNPGDWVGDAQCQSVEALTYSDESFDLCTSTDVFEHVVNDEAGFSEIHRVLKENGLSIFTVPLTSHEETKERAKYVQGELVHIEPAEYHDDYLRGPGKVLCFRTYGKDIVDRLNSAGFKQVEIDYSCATQFMGFGRAVVVAQK